MLDYRDPPRPDSPYGVGKLYGEAAARWFSDHHGMSMLCIRLGAVLDTNRPKLIRHFPGYLDQSDAVQMIERCLAAPLSLKFGIFDAISENSTCCATRAPRRTSWAGARPVRQTGSIPTSSERRRARACRSGSE